MTPRSSTPNEAEVSAKGSSLESGSFNVREFARTAQGTFRSELDFDDVVASGLGADAIRLLRLLRDLELPEFRDYAVDVPAPGALDSEPTRVLGQYLRDVFRLNVEARSFRLFGPDETASNRLDAVYEATPKTWEAATLPVDVALGRDGRVMEILSETTCQGWLEGYLLTGRHGLFS